MITLVMLGLFGKVIMVIENNSIRHSNAYNNPLILTLKAPRKKNASENVVC